MLKISNIKKSLGKKIIIDKVSFQCKRGEIFCIVGDNDSGKTTLLNTITGLVLPDEGSVVFEKNDIRSISYAPQVCGYNVNHYIKDEIENIAKVYNLNDEQRNRLSKIVKLLNLDKRLNSKFGNCSKSVWKKFNVMQAFAANTDWVVLDDPISSLDDSTCNTIKDIILTESKNNRGIIIASHKLSDVEEFGSSIYRLKDSLLSKHK